MSERDKESTCALCGEPMPAGEEMFVYHGYSGPCPKPPLSTQSAPINDPYEGPLDGDPSQATPAEGGAIAEPWAIYCPSICHVQRTYDTRKDAEAYCTDLNKASSVPEWVVVNLGVMQESIAQNAAPTATRGEGTPSREAVEAAYQRQSERVRGKVEGEYGPYTNQDWADVNTMYAAVRSLAPRTP